jgi:hypothetical protein
MVDRDPVLLPPITRERVPADLLAHFIMEAAGLLDLRMPPRERSPDRH